MKLQMNDLEVDLPYRLQQTVYVLKGNHICQGKIRRILVEFYSNTGYKNIPIGVQAVIDSGGVLKTFDIGCFSRSRKDAASCTTPRIVCISERSGIAFPPKAWPRHRGSDSEWSP